MKTQMPTQKRAPKTITEIKADLAAAKKKSRNVGAKSV
jgi:hypothetical protein